MAVKSNRRVLQSLQRASDILDIFTREKRMLGLADIAKIISLPKSTVQGLVYSLENLEFLEQDLDTFKYRLGPKLFNLGMKYLTNNEIFTTTQVWMERLSYKYRGTVNVGILIDGKAVIVMHIDPETPFTNNPKVGNEIPLHSSAIGKTLLATLDERQQRELLKNYQFTSYTENTIGNIDVFIDELKKVKREGLGFDNEESTRGLSCIGAGLYNKKGHIVAAFSVSGSTEHIRKEKGDIIDSIRSTSRELSKKIGFVGFL